MEGSMVATLDQQITMIKKYFEEVYENKNLSCLPDFLNKDAKLYSPFGISSGIENITSQIKAFLSAFSEIKIAVVETISQNNKMVVTWKLTGTVSNNFFGTQTKGQKVSYEGANLFVIQNNKIQECHVYSDLYKLLTQIGAVPNVLKTLTNK